MKVLQTGVSAATRLPSAGSPLAGHLVMTTLVFFADASHVYMDGESRIVE